MADEPADAPKRFYKAVQASPLEDGFGVLLDGRGVRTPGNARLILPNQALAALIAEEWEAQTATIQLARMSATRLAYTAVDRVAAARAATVGEVVSFAGSDLLCYLAEAPQALVQRQTRQWGAVLDWADRTLGVRLEPVTGIIHRAQPAESLARVRGFCETADDFALAGLAYGASLYGSAILALAVQKGEYTGEQAFDLSRLDEAFQEERWGVDDEAAARTANRRRQAVMLGQWFSALRA